MSENDSSRCSNEPPQGGDALQVAKGQFLLAAVAAANKMRVLDDQEDVYWRLAKRVEFDELQRTCAEFLRLNRL